MNSSLIRVSCSGFARIRDGQGRLLLHIAPKGRGIVMRPIGGAFLVTNEGRRQLTKYGVRLADFEDNGDELRFLAPVEQLWHIQDWFGRRDHELREINITRMLTNQLCSQMGVLTPNEVAGLATTVVGRTATSGATSRPGVKIRNTQYLVEVFDVDVPTEVLAKLKRATVGGKRPMHFASPAEIVEQSGIGGNVSSLARSLILSPKQYAK